MSVYGSWRTDAPLTQAELEEDQPLLEQVLGAIPLGVRLKSLEVWVHGREYEWRQIEVYR